MLVFGYFVLLLCSRFSPWPWSCLCSLALEDALTLNQWPWP